MYFILGLINGSLSASECFSTSNGAKCVKENITLTVCMWLCMIYSSTVNYTTNNGHGKNRKNNNVHRKVSERRILLFTNR